MCRQKFENTGKTRGGCHPALSYVFVYLLDVWPLVLYFINNFLNLIKLLVLNPFAFPQCIFLGYDKDVPWPSFHRSHNLFFDQVLSGWCRLSWLMSRKLWAKKLQQMKKAPPKKPTSSVVYPGTRILWLKLMIACAWRLLTLVTIIWCEKVMRQV